MSSQRHDALSRDADPINTGKPKIIGIYGIPGSGKSFLLKHLGEQFKDQDFVFYEGSAVINNIVPLGMSAFEKMDEHEKTLWRERAIKAIANIHSTNRKIAVIAGHYMFWPEIGGFPTVVCTPADLNTYTHILYLDTPVELIKQRRLDDNERQREPMSAHHLDQWQKHEKKELRQACYRNGILFSLVYSANAKLDHVEDLLSSIKRDDEARNQVRVRHELWELFHDRIDHIETFIVLDADRTLTSIDTGKALWKLASTKGYWSGEADPLKTLFSSELGYSHKAFEQAAHLYGESFAPEVFKELCQEVASSTVLYPQFLSLLQVLQRQKHIGILILTCGLRQIWSHIIDNHAFSGEHEHIKVIGSGRYKEEPVITGAIKTAVVHQIKDVYGKRVVAFGDSVLDLGMLAAADEAVVVVGDETTRSKAMEKALADAIEQHGLHCHQVLLPSTVSPRLDLDRLEKIDLTDAKIIARILEGQYYKPNLLIANATDKSATKILMTTTRDAQFHGPALREAHGKVGQYLALEYITAMIDTEAYPIRHVQGNMVDGYRLRHEEQTLIVALMRGGEPMAFGVCQVFPKAMFLHAKNATDIRPEHLESVVTIILVDSVINTGKSIIEFVEHINQLRATVHIVIVTGVAQARSIQVLQDLQASIAYNKLSLVALRVSDNQFSGKGATDTGHRLFNTTHLP